MTRTISPTIAVLISFIIFFPQCSYGDSQIIDVRYWSAPDHTRVVLDVKGETSYKYFALDNPDRLVVDFKDASASLPLTTVTVNDGIITQIRFGYFEKSVFRMVFDLVKPAQTKLFPMEKVEGKTERLVIELFRPDLKDLAEMNRTTLHTEFKDKKIVVIDPGHGGEDPGAIGRGGTFEKNVVLAFAKSLREYFNAKEGYQAVLTRERDYFISLRERVKIAQDYRANLFISIHADSNHIRGFKGSSVYCLSLQGASDEAARYLAEQENASDLIGGVPLSKNEDLNLTLIDLALTNTINTSLRLGAIVLREIKKVHPLKFETPRQAGFAVLKTPEIPSILIEVGFISNASEEQALKQKEFQATMAEAIFAASDEFLRRSEEAKGPVRHYPLAVKSTEEESSFSHQ